MNKFIHILGARPQFVKAGILVNRMIEKGWDCKIIHTGQHFDKNMSDVFFDYIKVLENAKSIHLIDSVWAAICYLLDAKYTLLKNIDVNVHCLRGYEEMFIEPKKLPNWKIN